MTISRKIFAESVTLPAITPKSLYELMRDSIQHWGFETTALTTPSMDSIIGTNVELTPNTGDVYMGNDANVRNVNATPLYRGVFLPQGETRTIQDPGVYGIIDPNQIYLWSQSGSTVDVVFTAR